MKLINKQKSKLISLFLTITFLIHQIAFVPMALAKTPQQKLQIDTVKDQPSTIDVSKNVPDFKDNEQKKQEAAKKLGTMGMPFIENKGQKHKDVKFYANTLGGTLFVTKKGELVYSLPKYEKDEQTKDKEKSNESDVEKESSKPKKGWSLKETLVGANINEPVASDETVTKANYFIGNDESKWKKNISTFNQVNLGEVYPNIDFHLNAYGNNVEKIFTVNPNGNVDNIKLQIKGGKSLKVDSEGQLEVETGLGTVKFTKPVAYQENNGIKEYVEVSYTIDKHTYGFAVGNYDKSKPLIIDPLLASTYFGINESEWVNQQSLAIDELNYVYITEYIYSISYPITIGQYQTSFTGGNDDILVAKLDSNLETLFSFTFIGGTKDDTPSSLTIDNNGNVFLTGTTSSTEFPTTDNAYKSNYLGGGSDGFILKLDTNFVHLLSSTFLGGNDYDVISHLALDQNNNIYVTGNTWSANFPTSEIAYDKTHNGAYDMFVTKLDNNLHEVQASTYIGGSDFDYGGNIGIDSKGNIYITGKVRYSSYPTTANAFQPASTGGYDSAVISKLDTNLQELLASTFIGGSADDYIKSLAIDKYDNIYVAGYTKSSDFPIKNAYDGIHSGGQDGFIAKLDTNLQELIASTFIGGTANDFINSLALDSNNYAYVSGNTSSEEFPTTYKAYDKTYGSTDWQDIFISRFTSDLRNITNSTLLGVRYSYDKNHSLQIDNEGNIYINGLTDSNDFPTTENAFDTTYEHVYIAKFSGDLSENKPISGLSNVEQYEMFVKDLTEYRDPSSFDQDPIDTASGAQIIERTLLNVNGAQPISLKLNYNSLLLKEGPLGKGWGHNFETHLDVLENGDIDIYWSANSVNRFLNNGTNNYISADLTTRFDILVKNPDNSYTVTCKDKEVFIFNTAGQLIEKKNSNGQSLIMTYNELGQLVTVTEPISGRSLTFTYYPNGLLEKVSDNLNRKVGFSYNANNCLEVITDAKNQTTTYTYNDLGQVLTGTDYEGITFFSNTYDAQGRIIAQDDAVAGNLVSSYNYDETSEPGKIITTITNRNGDTRILTHNHRYQLISIKDELGNIIETSTFDADGNRTSISDANGHTTTFTYDERGNLLTTTDAKGNTTTMTYDDRDNLLSVENATGKITTYIYDNNNNVTSITDALGNKNIFEYSLDSLLLSETPPNQGVTTYTYVYGLVDTVTDAVYNTTSYEYDVVGRLVKIYDPIGKATSMNYDEADNLTSIIGPLGNTVSYTYNSHGDKLTETDARGNTTTYEYNGNGKLIKVIDALNHETIYAYDGEDRLIKITDPKGNFVQYEYDDKGRLINIIDPLGNTSTIEYDIADNVIGNFDALGNKIQTITYDEVNNPVTVTDAVYRTTANEYDILNRLSKRIDPMGRVTNLNYDDLNRVTSVIDPLNNVSSQVFDVVGNRTSFKDPNNNVTNFTYDLLGRVLARTDTTGNTISYSYNSRSLLEQMTNGRNQVTTYEYDDAGRITGFTDPTGTVSYTYDSNGNIETVNDNNGTITREYDELNRITKYIDSQGNIIQYSYDEVGNLKTLTYPDNKVVTYDYDAANRLTKVTDWAGRVTSYEYDANGRLIKTIRPDASIQTQTYDKAGQLTQQKDVDKNSNIISQYDFTYDDAGNVATEVSGITPQPFTISNVTMTYTSDNCIDTFNGQAVVYDADGNMVTGPLNGQMVEYNYDSRNRLTSAGNVSYVYDAENNRIKVIESGKETSYVINPTAGLSQVLVKTDDTNNKTYYVYGLGLIGQEENGEYKSYHYDRRGSTVAITDAQGLVTDTFQYSTYGELVNRIGTTETPFLYNGRYGVMTDANGLYYMRARYYNPEIKRFINQDVVLGSINNGQTLNRYAYTNGNPVSYLDPFGLSRDGDDSSWSNIDEKMWNKLIRGVWKSDESLSEYEKLTTLSPILTGYRIISADIPEDRREEYLERFTDDFIIQLALHTTSGSRSLQRPSKAIGLTPRQLNQYKNQVTSGNNIHFKTKAEAIDFINKKFPDFAQEVAGNRSAEGWHFDNHPIGGSKETINHINIYSKLQNFRVHITWGE